MAAQSVKQRNRASVGRDRYNRRLLDEAILADLTALRTSITTLTAKLDADAGVIDTNYAATCNPAALNTRA